MYTGKFESVELRKTSETAVQQNQLIVSQLESKINDLKKIQENLTVSITSPETATGVTGATGATGATGGSPATNVAEEQAAVNAASTAEGIVTVTAESAGITEAITEAAGSSKPVKINIPEVPGVTTSLESANFSKVRPKVENPSGGPISVKIRKPNDATGMNPDGSPNFDTMQ